MAQSVKLLTLDLSSGLDLRVVSSSPALGSVPGISLLKKRERERERERESLSKYDENH